jgi:RND family efflux transporter MFP subunit
MKLTSAKNKSSFNMIQVNIKSIIGISALLLVVACGKKQTDKKAELDALIKEQVALNEKIKTLRAELEKKGDIDTKTKRVEVLDINSTTFVHYIEVQAKVDGDQNVNVAPQMGGTVKSILVKQGQTVSKGQLLAHLDDAVLIQGINELKSQVDFATNLYKKQENLWNQKIGSELQYLSAKNNKESLENKMRTLVEQRNMTDIKSPINGTVDNIAIKEGQAIAPGLPCVNVVNLSSLKVKGELSEAYIEKVKTGDEVIIIFPDGSNNITARATYVSKVVNPMTRTFTVEVQLEKVPAELRPGMVAILKVVDYKTPSAYVVPVNNIQTDENGNYVLIAMNNSGKAIVAKKAVQTGASYGGMVEIKSGLEAGDKLISKGYQGLNEGEEVLF